MRRQTQGVVHYLAVAGMACAQDSSNVESVKQEHCLAGYVVDGEGGCTDVNECFIDNGGCDALTLCSNTEGSRTCGSCPASFTGNGESGCADIDECLIDNGGCDPLTACINTGGSHMCSDCPAGYAGDGESACADINECLADNGDCDPLTSCSNFDGGRTCGACPSGYFGDGDAGCVEISTSTATARMATGGYHSCALSDSGAVRCWGNNFYGQLGDGRTETHQATPVEVSGIDGIAASAVAVAAGSSHTCALLDSGAVKCWGKNHIGQLGDGGIGTNQATPVGVTGIDGIAASAVAVTTHNGHPCALLDSGAVRCWGGREYGQLGDGGTGTHRATPVEVSGIDGIAASAIAVAAGEWHTCALLDSGAVRCWGGDAQGQVGDGAFHTEHAIPVEVSGIDGIAASAVMIAAGGLHTCAVLGSGALNCWGGDHYGQLGDGGTITHQPAPVEVFGIDGIVASAVTVAAGSLHTCAVLDSGGVKCWGQGDYGQLGDGGTNPEQSTPVEVSGIDGVASSAVEVTAGRWHTCALLDSRAVRCWGRNTDGQLGDGNIGIDQYTPVEVVGIDGIAASAVTVAAGVAHTCALLDSGVVKCWGGDAYGQLGNPPCSGTGCDVPMEVVGIP